MTFTIYAENEEKQIHNDRYHGEREVTTYSKIKVHTNEAPPICEVTKKLERQKIKGFTYSKTIIRLRLDEIELIKISNVYGSEIVGQPSTKKTSTK